MSNYFDSTPARSRTQMAARNTAGQSGFLAGFASRFLGYSGYSGYTTSSGYANFTSFDVAFPEDPSISNYANALLSSEALYGFNRSVYLKTLTGIRNQLVRLTQYSAFRERAAFLISRIDAEATKM